jgi:hypothetical protein
MSKPEVGMTIKVRGIMCRIVAILPAYTIEVVSIAGAKSFRVSGLYW